MGKTLFLVLHFLASVAVAEKIEFVDLPEGCLEKREFPCSVRASHELHDLKFGNSLVSMPDDSSVKFIDTGKLQLLKGHVWIRQSDLMEVLADGQTAKVSGDILVSKEDGKIFLRNLSGSVSFASDKVFPSEMVPVGFENWYALQAEDGKVQRGVIIAFSDEKVFKILRPLLTGSREEQIRLLVEYKKRWKGRAEVGADFYQEIISRRFAVQEDSKRKSASIKSKQEEQNRKLRQMFRQRNNLDQ